MKKIFTLLFCLMGMTFVADATDLTPVQDCINYLLANRNNSHMLMASANADMDANHDGIINITDVTFMINEMLVAEREANAPARDTDIKKLIKEVLESETEKPNITDVTDAINEKLNEE